MVPPAERSQNSTAVAVPRSRALAGVQPAQFQPMPPHQPVQLRLMTMPAAPERAPAAPSVTVLGAGPAQAPPEARLRSPAPASPL